jgi:hypothetical protein
MSGKKMALVFGRSVVSYSVAYYQGGSHIKDETLPGIGITNASECASLHGLAFEFLERLGRARRLWAEARQHDESKHGARQA